MAGSYVTQWHRFNTVATTPTMGSGFSADNLIGTSIGTASLEETNDVIELSDPNIIDSSGTQLEFSEEIPSTGTITGIEFQYFVSSSAGLPNDYIRTYSKLSSLGDYTQRGANTTYNGILASDGGINDKLGLTTLSLSNVDDIRIHFLLYNSPFGTDFYFHGTLHGETNGPSPAVRVYYNLYPKLTVTTGKLNITSGKVSIS